MAFSFGTAKTMTGFTLPTTSAPTTSTALGGAGDTQNKPAVGLFGTSAPPSFALNTSAHAPTGLSLGTSTPAPGGFTLGTQTSKTTGFSLGGATTTTSTGFSLGTAATGATGFSLGVATPSSTTVTTTSAGTSVVDANVSAAKTTSTIQFPQPISTAATSTSFTPILGLGGASASITTSTSTPLKITGLGTSSTPASTTATVTTAVTSTAASTIVPPGGLTFAQLEDSINKWTIDLEEQGKFFINQAKELNAWDNLLISNGEKILSLNETIERVKQQQKQLDQELDFVLAQQNELDELSSPLEKQLSDIPITDQGRFQMYQLSEIIDSQLKQMSEDLKEIIEHLNESNKNEDVTDPVIQISRILNAYMNSLQWIDRNTTQISSHLEQISKLHELHKNNHLNM